MARRTPATLFRSQSQKLSYFGLSIILMATSLVVASPEANALTNSGPTVTQNLTSDFINQNTQYWPVGATVCNNYNESYNVAVTFILQTVKGINTVGSSVQSLGDIGANTCKDVYFQIEVGGVGLSRVPAGSSQTAKYNFTFDAVKSVAGSANPNSWTITTPNTHQIYIEQDVQTTNNLNIGTLTGVGLGTGAVNLAVGETYTFSVNANSGTNARVISVNAFFDPAIFQVLQAKANYPSIVSNNMGYFYNYCSMGTDYTVAATYRSCANSNNMSNTTISMTYTVKVIGEGTQSSIPVNINAYYGSQWKFNGGTAAVGGISSFVSSYSLTTKVNGTSTGNGVTATSTFDTSTSGLLSGSQPNISACGSSTCSATAIYKPNSFVTLTPVPAAGQSFAGWTGGGCALMAATCTVKMTSSITVTANFGAVYPLGIQISGEGTGSLTSNTGGINCVWNGTSQSGTCSATFSTTSNTQVVLTAKPDSGMLFDGWGGACAGLDKTTLQCTVSMSQARNVTAVFIIDPILTVLIASNSSTTTGGTAIQVTSSDSSISCTSLGSTLANSTTGDCIGNYVTGHVITLYAPTDTGNRPVWSIFPLSSKTSGCGAGSDSCTLTMNLDTQITVTYTGQPMSVGFDSANTGTGVVTSSDSAINCGEINNKCFTVYTNGSATSVTLTANAASGSAIIGWALSGVSATSGCTSSISPASSATCTFNVISSGSPITVTAKIALSVSLSLSVTGTGTGSISLSNSTTCSTTCTQNFATSPYTSLVATALPSPNSYFIGWSGTCTGNSATCSFTMDQARSLTAQYGPTYTLTYTAGANGTISGPSPQTVNGGDSGTAVTAVPASGYHFATWSDGVSTATRLDTSVSSNKTVSASFAIDTFTITASIDSHGTITPSGATTVNSGATQAYSISTSTGYHIDQVLVDGVNNLAAISSGSYSFTNVTANHTISVTTSIDTFTITSSVDSHGTISPLGDSTVNYGGSKAYTFSADSGYHITHVYIDDVDSSTAVNTGGYTFTNVTAGHTISVTTAINTYTITASVDSHGTISPAGGSSVNSGGTQPYTFSANAGYHITQVLIDGVNDTTAVANGSYTFTNVTAGHTISVLTSINTYTISATVSGGNGSISAATSPANHGTSQSFTLTPATGYHVATLTDNTVDVKSLISGGAYTLTNISADHTIVVTFSINVYTLTYTAGAGGTISGTTPQSINYGDTGTSVTAIPNTGYHFVQWSDGVLTTTRTDGSVLSDFSVTAQFAMNTYTITASVSGGHGSITTATSPANYGTSQTFILTPDAGYHIATLTDGGQDISSGITAGKYTLASISADHSIVVTFALDTFAYTIHFLPGDSATGTMADLTGTGSSVKLSQMTFNGGSYHFAGWKADNGEQFTDEQVISLTGTYGTPITLTLTATWSMDIYTYSVSYSPGDHGSGSMSTQSGSGNTVNTTANAFVAEAGYHWVSWLGSDGVTYTNSDVLVLTSNLSITLTAVWAINTYSFTTAVSSGNGSVSTPSSPVNYGETRTVTFSPNTGYHIYSVTDNGTRVEGMVVSNTYVVGSISSAHEIIVVYAINSYSVEYTADTGGTISGSTSQTVDHGSNATTVTATPNTGYHFVSWTGGSTNPSRTDSNVTSNLSLTATFAIDTFTVTYSAGTGGTISGLEIQTINYNGSTTSVTANPSTGYHFVSWSDGNVSASRSESNVTSSKTLSATFAIDTFTVTATVSGGNGTITTAISPANYDSSQTFNLTPATGYKVSTLTDNGVDVKASISGGSYTINPIRTNHALIVTFTKISLTVTYSSGSGGSITGSLSQSILYGESATAVTATPSTGYHFVSWSNGSTNPTRLDTNVTSSVTYTATFDLDTFTVTSEVATGNGTITAAINPADYDSSQSFTLTPATGYEISAFTDNNVDRMSSIVSGVYSLSNIKANHALVVTFSIKRITISYVAGAGGSITGTAIQTINYGDSTTAVTATPNTGYHFVNWSAGAVSATRFDSNVTSSTTYTASFAIDTFTITVISGAHGTISPGTSSAIEYGTTPTYTISPASGYQVETVTVDSVVVSLSSGGTYTFTAISADHTIEASFIPVPAGTPTFTITLVQVGSGAITTTIGTGDVSSMSLNSPGTANDTFYQNDFITFSTTVANHWARGSWSLSGVIAETGCTSGGVTCRIKVTADATITFTFIKITHTLTLHQSGMGTINSSDSLLVTNTDSGTASYTYDEGTSVSFTASAAAGYTFQGWSSTPSVCSGTATCTFDNSQSASITGTFIVAASGSSQLTITIYGPAGSVSSTPSGITDCRTTSGICAYSFTNGTNVTLTSSPTSEVIFEGWGGACASAGTSANCILTINSATNVTARFAALRSSGSTTPAPKTFKVIFNNNDGTASKFSRTYTVGGSAILFPLASLKNYDFLGWFTDPQGEEFLGGEGFSYSPSADVELFAGWKLKEQAPPKTTLVTPTPLPDADPGVTPPPGMEPTSTPSSPKSQPQQPTILNSILVSAVRGEKLTVREIAVAPIADENNGLEVAGRSWTLAINSTIELVVGTPTDTTRRIAVEEGNSVSSFGTGFKPNSQVDIFVYSEPIWLGSVITDSKGNYQVTLPMPAALALGQHTFQAQGVTFDNVKRVANVPITLLAKTSPLLSKRIRIQYTMNSYFLDPPERRKLDTAFAELKKRIVKNSRVTVEIYGWVQPTVVNPNINGLSTGRAVAVMRYLKKIGLRAKFALNAPGLASRNVPSSRYASVNIIVSNPG